MSSDFFNRLKKQVEAEVEADKVEREKVIAHEKAIVGWTKELGFDRVEHCLRGVAIKVGAQGVVWVEVDRNLSVIVYCDKPDTLDELVPKPIVNKDELAVLLKHPVLKCPREDRPGYA